MTDENIVILARPHPFIAQHMKKFLVDLGYTPFPIQGPDDLKNLTNTQAIKGAIISTSLTSESGESYVDDFKHLREKFPDLPIMFATLGKIDDMLKPVSHAIAAEAAGAKVIEVNADNLNHPGLGTKDIFLLVHKDGVANADTIPVTAQMLAKHFRAKS